MAQMINQYCSENVASTSDAKSAASNSLLIKYGNKNVELKIMQDVMSMYENNLLEKEKILEEEKRKLEELNNQAWSVEDSFCKEVWQFSKEHDFSVIFEQYPFVMQIDCVKQKINNEDNVEKSFELIDLIKEIDVIQAEICSLKRKNVKCEVESALTYLQKLQITSEDIKELLNLISPSELTCRLAAISIPVHDEIIPDSENKVRRRKNDSDCEDLKIKKIRGNQNESSVKNKSCLKSGKSKRKVTIATPNNYSQLPIERSIILTAEMKKPQIMNAFVKLTNIETQKLQNFTPKKRSEISIKFEQSREYK
ncbi:repetitive organellar protein-like [Linepithema humile]|uniref:repetitive organellar protein-like n=1 Tax=Linepithema humile TaxID=83485 RepID=UPI0006233D2A|nr:PREDICTED: uncharacterized protein LOC105668435 [Linepithema humile]